MSTKKDYIVRIPIKNERGEKVGEVEAISFKGLLAIAHEEGLRSVKTVLVEKPSAANNQTAIVSARVRTNRGSFTGTGDANPDNVNRRIAPHVIRMAETRALARAFRLAVNIGEVAVEELGEDLTADTRAAQQQAPRPAAPQAQQPPLAASQQQQPRPSAPRVQGDRSDLPQRFRGRDPEPTQAASDDRRAMSDDQKRLLYRLVLGLGESRETARDRVLQALGVDRLEHATRVHASRAIDALKNEIAAQGNGHGPANTNGAAPNGANGHA